MIILDVNKRPIQPGARIVYAVRLGSCSVALRTGLVLTTEFKLVPDPWPSASWRTSHPIITVETANKRRVKLSYPERIAVL